MGSYNSTYSARVEHVAGVTTVLSNVQNVTIKQGRSNLSDQYRSAVMTIDGLSPSSLPSIKVGDLIRVTLRAFNNGVEVTLPTWEKERTGRVSDIQVDYGIIPSLDTWTITTEDAIAVLGRAVVDVTVSAGTVTSTAAKQITDAAGVTMTIAGSSVPSSSTVRATTFAAANALDAFQTYANTELAYVVQQGDQLTWIPRSGWTFTGSLATFSDEKPADPSYLEFSQLAVGNLADTVAQEVVVSIRGGNTVVAGSGRTYVQYQTYDSSDAQALNLAQFIKALFTNDKPVPYTLSYVCNGQDPARVFTSVATELRQVTLRFRGTVSQAIVLGYTISITPEASRISLNLLSIEQIPLFILNSTTNGVLNQNVLGY